MRAELRERAGALRAAAQLARWLGPWAGDAAPRGIARRTVSISRTAPGGELRAHVYEPPRPRGAWLVVPGLHFAGPDDPRLDRFCRILAAAGHLVVAPFLPSFSRLLVEPSVEGDLADHFDEAERLAAARGLPPPALLSISFGGLPAAALAARPSHRDRIASWVSFGGYCDFGATVRFALSGRFSHRGEEVVAPRDPLNAPVVILNVLPHLPLGAEVDRARVAEALREVAHRTWGRMELKRPGARDPIVHAVAGALPPPERELVLVASGLRPGALELLDEGLLRAGDAFGFADPRPHLAAVRAEVTVVHGRDDDVIPWVEADKLHACLPSGRARKLVTGLFGHTGAALPRPSDVIAEVRASGEILRSLVRAPRVVGSGGSG